MALVKGSSSSATPGAIYSSTGDTAITFLSITNVSATDATVNLYVVPAGSSADNTTLLYKDLFLEASDTYQVYIGGEKLLLSAGDSVYLSTTVGSTITTLTSYTSI